MTPPLQLAKWLRSQADAGVHQSAIEAADYLEELVALRQAVIDYLGQPTPSDIARILRNHEGGGEFADPTLARLVRAAELDS